MKTILITAPSSGSGKTTITMGIIRALKKMGLNITPFKTGPDYIDTGFLGMAAGVPAGNLDMHLQSKAGVFESLAIENNDYCVIEGAMGYFDGIYNTYDNSSYDISKTLGINSVLIYSPKGEMFSAIPKIKGMAEFEESNIKGVIFNNVSESHYVLLKEALEKHTKLKALGYIPKLKELEIGSRHLGLLQSVEIENVDEKIEKVAEAVKATVDLDSLINFMIELKPNKSIELKKRNIRVGIAKDKAFSFYYKENIHILESISDVVYFSPLEDEVIPECDLLYLGGGYPEVFKERLSENKSMLNSVKQFADKGGSIYAECGGFMYLTKEIEGFEMVGILDGKSRLTSSLQRFGYIDIELGSDCPLGTKGDRITGHEFHKSVVEGFGEGTYKIKKTLGNRNWECGYQYKNVFGGYPHINFIGNMKVLYNIFDWVERSK